MCQIGGGKKADVLPLLDLDMDSKGLLAHLSKQDPDGCRSPGKYKAMLIT